MARKLRRLTPDTLADLPAEVQECVFWELDPVARARAESAGIAAEEKRAWLSGVLLAWGSCGRVLYLDDGDGPRAVGCVLYAPPVYLPGTASLPTAPISDDAVQLATVYVDPAYRRGGLGRVLLQGMAKDLVKRGDVRAVEAIAATGPHACALPAEFLARTGFTTQRAHMRHPRMRMELASLLTWRDEVEAALDRLRGVVLPQRAPGATTPRWVAPNAMTSSRTHRGSVRASPKSSRS